MLNKNQFPIYNSESGSKIVRVPVDEYEIYPNIEHLDIFIRVRIIRT